MFNARDFIRFWSKVQIAAGGCAEWIGATFQSGYGNFYWNGRNHPAQRISWLMAGNLINDGQYVLHHCDNRRCVEPNHLFTGTHQDNMDDMAKKGRRASQKGSLNGNAKLTPEQVSEIKRDRRSHRAIASDYAVSKTTIGLIKSCKRWVREFPK